MEERGESGEVISWCLCKWKEIVSGAEGCRMWRWRRSHAVLKSNIVPLLGRWLVCQVYIRSRWYVVLQVCGDGVVNGAVCDGKPHVIMVVNGTCM